MKIIVNKSAISFGNLKVGEVCRIDWDDCCEPTYGMKIEQLNGEHSIVDFDCGEIIDINPSTMVIPVECELRIL